MGENMKKENKNKISIGILSIIIMIIAIGIIIMNPSKIQKVPEQTIYIKNDNSYEQIANEDEINKQEEIDFSMHVGGTICKIDNKVVFYEKESKTIYCYQLENNLSNPLVTLEEGADKIYFDGEYIYAIPYYYDGKGIYKIDLQGNIKKIFEDYASQLYLTEAKIYFVKQIGFDDFNKNPQGTICKMDKNGENVVELAQEIKNQFFVQNNKIYYTTQDRKMYVMNNDGSEVTNLMQGRKFVIGISDKYLLYVDYSDKEAKHILNLETNDDAIIGYGGTVGKYQGKYYIMCQKRQDDGALETEFTVFELNNNGIVREITKVSDIEAKLKYVKQDKIYLNNQEYVDDYFLGGYRYKIDISNPEQVELEIIEL